MPQGSDQLRFGALVLPNEPWADLESRWQRLEDGGVDTPWSCDHFTDPRRPGQPWFEGWSALVAMAASTFTGAYLAEVSLRGCAGTTWRSVSQR